MKIKPETLARGLLFLLLAAAGFVGVLAAAQALGLGTPQGVVTLHARMPENGGWSEETLHARAGQPLRLRLTSDDVLHSFAIGQLDEPALDLLPGEWVETSLTFDRPGRYTFYCTRWCGRNHWRMRGTILVEGAADGSGVEPTAEVSAVDKPLYLQLGLALDAAHLAETVPTGQPSAERGAALAERLPAWALERQTYLETSPSALWQRLRADPALAGVDDAALWDGVAYLWQRQTSPEKLAEAARLFARDCAACHGETGRGDGVMVQGLPRFEPGAAHPMEMEPTPEPGEITGADVHGEAGEMAPTDMGLSAPPDFTDPRILLGAPPALLEGKMLRGGMGTGMPYWGPIHTPEQRDMLISYLYRFALSR